MTHDEIGDWLATQGCFTLGTDAFYGRLPATPTNATAIRESGGIGARLVFGGVAYEQPSMQFLVRNSSYAAGRAAIQAIYDALMSIGNSEIGGVRYLTATCQTPALLEYDDAGMPIFGLDVEFAKEPS